MRQIVAKMCMYTFMNKSTQYFQHMRYRSMYIHVCNCRAGGTRAAGKAMAVPVFSRRVICPRAGPYQVFSIRVIRPKSI